jgi:threonyl-tRNA synthetase
MNEWAAYLPFCQSERQAQVISLRAQGMTAEKVSESIGIARRTILATCARVKANAAKQGYSPDHDMIHTVPDGFTVSGTSTLYKDGEPIMQWVKSKNDAIAMFEQALESFKEGLIEDVHGKAETCPKAYRGQRP